MKRDELYAKYIGVMNINAVLKQQNAELLEALKALMDDRHNWEAWLDAENVIAKVEDDNNG